MCVGDIGTQIDLTVTDEETGAVIDISSATVTKDYIFRKPNGARVVKAASFIGSGADGQLRYTTLSGDIDQAGAWRVQVKVVYTSGTFLSDPIDFTVDNVL